MASDKTSVNGNQTLHAFFKGAVVPMDEAKVSVMTHALHYGTAVFEGIRGNWNEEQGKMFIFRMREHYERLIRGCKILLLEIPYDADQLCDITVDLVEQNGHQSDIYIRPLAYKSATAFRSMMAFPTTSPCRIGVSGHSRTAALRSA